MSHDPQQHSLAGVWLAVAAAVLFGASTPVAKGLLASTAPEILAGLLYVGSGIGLTLLRLVDRRAAGAEAPLTGRDGPWLAGATLFGGLLGPLLLMAGLQVVPSSSASLLLNLEGVFTALLAWVVFHENVDRRVATGMVLIVAGSLALSWQGTFVWQGLAGPAMIAGACLCWAIDNNLTQKVAAGDPKVIAAIKGLAAGSVNLALGLWTGHPLPNPTALSAALVIGFAGYGLSLMLFVLALRALGTARTGAYFSVAPFVGAGLGLLLWHDALTPQFGLATVLMGAGIGLHLTERHHHEHAHEAMTHAHRHVHDAHHQHDHGPDDPTGEPHSHVHTHAPLVHRHAHFPDVHHRHRH